MQVHCLPTNYDNTVVMLLQHYRQCCYYRLLCLFHVWCVLVFPSYTELLNMPICIVLVVVCIVYQQIMWVLLCNFGHSIALANIVYVSLSISELHRALFLFSMKDHCLLIEVLVSLTPTSFWECTYSGYWVTRTYIFCMSCTCIFCGFPKRHKFYYAYFPSPNSIIL